MTKSILTVFAGAALVAGTILAEEGGADPKAGFKKYAEMGAGVYNQKTESVNGKNVFKSCIIVGEARFSTALGVRKGLSVARRNAKLSAEATFISWMKTHVSSVSSSGDETVYELTGKNGEDNPSENAASAETSSQQITSAAQGAIRGMQKEYEWRDSESNMLYVVYAWKPDFAELTTQVEQAMEPAPAQQTKTPKGKTSSSEGKKDGETKTFEDKELIAPGAEEFF